MKRFKDIAFISLLSFTLMALCGLLVLNAAAGAFGGSAEGEETIRAFASDVADGGFAIFVYSVLIGLSFMIFDAGFLSAFWKRALHLVLNYALMVAFFIMLTAGHSGRGIILLVLTFVFTAVYFLGLLLCRGLKKLGAVLDEAKKSKKN